MFHVSRFLVRSTRMESVFYASLLVSACLPSTSAVSPTCRYVVSSALSPIFLLVPPQSAGRAAASRTWRSGAGLPTRMRSSGGQSHYGRGQAYHITSSLPPGATCGIAITRDLRQQRAAMFWGFYFQVVQFLCSVEGRGDIAFGTVR